MAMSKAVMAVLDVSINMVSLLAFIMAIGLVVDDSIVIGESIDRERRHGAGSRKFMSGVYDLSTPVVLAVLTTILFLLPILWAPGSTAKAARSLPIVVSACLLFSLVESLLALPAHLTAGSGNQNSSSQPAPTWWRPDRYSNQLLVSFIRNVYRPLLERAIRYPYVTISTAFAALLIVIACLIGGLVPFNLFPATEADKVTAEFEMPQGTPQADMERVIEQIERAAVDRHF